MKAEIRNATEGTRKGVESKSADGERRRTFGIPEADAIAGADGFRA